MDVVIFDHSGNRKVTVTAQQGSKAAASLMTHDYIQLRFCLDTPVTFQIGDYCNVALVRPSKWWDRDDETFYLLDIHGNGLLDLMADRLGFSDNASTPVRYIVTDRTTPTYNATTGAWDYELKLDAWYYAWNRYILKLNPMLGAISTTFAYTSTFIEHFRLVMMQLAKAQADGDTLIDMPTEVVVHYLASRQVTGGRRYFERKVWYRWDPEYSMFDEEDSLEEQTDIDQYSAQAASLVSPDVKLVSYDSTMVIDAIKAMCADDAYNCEWWMDGNVMHFGRCERGTSIKVENDVDAIISASPSSGAYATRVIAFGSTTNVPARYRKTLVFTITDQGTTIGDRTRPVSPSMFPNSRKEAESGSFTWLGNKYGQAIIDATLGTHTVTPGKGMKFKANDFYFSAEARIPGYEVDMYNIASSVLDSHILLRFFTASGTELPASDLRIYCSSTEAAIMGDQIQVTARYDEEVSFEVPDRAATIQVILMDVIDRYDVIDRTKLDYTYRFETTNYKTVATAKVLSGALQGETLDVTINPFFANPSSKEACAIQGLEQLRNGDTYTFTDIDEDSVPVSYYTDDFGLQSIASYERRLMLPIDRCPGNYIDAEGTQPQQIVEVTKTFDDIFPKMDLQIAKVKWSKRERVTNTDDDGSVYFTYPVRFSIFIRQADLDFKSKYIVKDKTLQAQFQSGTLAGYTFDLEFVPSSSTQNGRSEALQEYRIVPANINGITIPNEHLYPQGFENDRISEISPAIKEEGSRYTEQQPTTDHLVMLNYNAKAITSMGLVAKAEEELYQQAKSYLEKVSRDEATYSATMFHTYFEDMDAMPAIGQKVSLVDAGLFQEPRQTRVIGYDIPLDIPIDHPVYTIGESPRYSRLGAIEKKQK